MYHHCKATEDHDLDVVEFWVEHVSGIGQIMEGIEHENEPEEDGDKPHSPISFTPSVTFVYLVTSYFISVSTPKIVALSIDFPLYKKALYALSFNTSVFRPPIV